MIRLLKKRPEPVEIFGGLCDNALFYEHHDETEPYAYTGFEIYSNRARVHMHILRWSHTIAKNLKADWNLHGLMLLELGVDNIIAINEDAEDKRWYKFIRLFGFGKPIMVQQAKLKIYKLKE